MNDRDNKKNGVVIRYINTGFHLITVEWVHSEN